MRAVLPLIVALLVDGAWAHPDTTASHVDTISAAHAEARTMAARDYAEGQDFGIMAANEKSMVVDTVSGIGIGAFTGLLGTGIMYLSAKGDQKVPDYYQSFHSHRSAAFQQGFQAGYTNRTKERRRWAATSGGLVGTLLLASVLIATQSQ